jgi:adenylate cyclase
MLRSLRSYFGYNRTTLTLAVIIVVTSMFVTGVTILDQFELRTYDLRFVSRGTIPTSSSIVLAMVDEKSLDVEGRWPWPRAKFARLIDRLSDAGAKVIAFDIGFLEPDENSQLKLLDDLDAVLGRLRAEDSELETFLSETRASADNDRALSEAMNRSSTAIVLGYFFHMEGDRSGFEASQKDIAARFERIDSAKYPLIRYRGGTSGDSGIPKALAPETNIAVLTEAATSSGYFSVKQDLDGILRWMPLVVAGGAEFFPPLSLAAVWQFLDQPVLMVRVGPSGVDGIQLGDLLVPTDQSGRLLINYLGPPQTFPHVSISEILADTVSPEIFRGKIVVVGASATGIYDTRATPFSSAHLGTEVQASVMDNLISRRFVIRPGWSKIYDAAAIALLAVVAALGLWRLSPIPSVFFVAALFAGHVFLSRLLFVQFGVWLNVVYPLLALVGTYVAITVYEFFTEQRERRRLRSAFAHYVAPVVVEEIVKDPTRLELGGEEKVLTVLFSDLEGFTSYSEHYSPQQMIEILSEYYARMTERVFFRSGTLKEYVGDELMAIFGAPIDQDDHAERACHAAIEMRAELEALSNSWAAQGRPRLRARIGINTGPMLVGNLGSKYRFSYGVLGDAVNLGSRLEGLNKQYRTGILIGENTAKAVKDSFILREIDLVRAVGKKTSTRIYELVATIETNLPLSQRDLFSVYESGLAAYRDGRWGEAIELFGEGLRRHPGDGPAQVLLDRCRDYVASPPDPDWGGVFVATRK